MIGHYSFRLDRFQFGMFFVIFVSMRLILIFSLLLAYSVKAQSYFQEHFGGTAGIVFNLGSHTNSVGLNLRGYHTDFFYQVNAGSTFYFYKKGLGKRINYWESRNSLGLVLLAGKKEMTRDFQLDGLNHQTNYNLGAGYNYLWYFDNIGTSQRSGGFGFHVKNISVYHENDVFGGQGKDRYRTAHFYASYRSDEFKVGAGFNLWTGETKGARWEKMTSKKAPNGFKILENLPYGKTSHGIAYGAFVYNLPYGQDVHLRLGVDSDNIRHAIQNRLIHDMIFMPIKMKNTTPHYPRLDEFGCPVFDKEGVRDLKFYMQFGMNENWSN